MRFYPKNDLYTHYQKYSVDTWLSPRVHDHTIVRSLELINRAINCCEHWGVFLDIGAGSGRYSVALAHKFERGYAVEIDKNEDLERVAKKYKNISVIRKPIQKVKLPEKSDFILLADVFEHIPVKDIPLFMRSLAATQRKGGVVYVMTPNKIVCGPEDQSGIHHTRHPFGHQKHYVESELSGIFSDHGYERIFVRFEDSPLRSLLKMPMLFLSVWDKKYHFPLVQLADFIFYLVGKVVMLEKKRREMDELNLRTICAAYRKI